MRPGERDLLLLPLPRWHRCRHQRHQLRPSRRRGGQQHRPFISQPLRSPPSLQVHTFLSADTPFATEYRFGCEPYTIVPRADAHAYEETFVGYGKDRVSWNYELAAKQAAWHVVGSILSLPSPACACAQPSAISRL